MAYPMLFPLFESPGEMLGELTELLTERVKNIFECKQILRGTERAGSETCQNKPHYF